MSINQLTIGTKEDTPAKATATASIPANQKLTAEEINQITGKVNQLVGEVNGLQPALESIGIPLFVTAFENISTSASWNGKVIHIDNSSNDINLIVNDVINAVFTKLGTGTITVTAGTKTLVLADNIDECNGVKGSTFLLTPDETTPNQLILLMSNR